MDFFISFELDGRNEADKIEEKSQQVLEQIEPKTIQKNRNIS